MEQLTKIPEFILFNHVERAIQFIRDDYEEQADKTKSFLYKVLNGNGIERYDLYKQALTVFIDNNENNPRYLEVHMMFNMEREGLPTVHITLPSEQTQTGGNGMGMDEGYVSEIVEESVYNDQDQLVNQGSLTPVYTRRYQSTYNIVITSDNSNEVILIYHTLRAILTAMLPYLHLAGLENGAFGGQDVQLASGLASQMYIRSIAITLQYETSVPSLDKKMLVRNLFANGTPTN